MPIVFLLLFFQVISGLVFFAAATGLFHASLLLRLLFLSFGCCVTRILGVDAKSAPKQKQL
jgi:UPF0716 family protein affecting phage T7 exclusion